MRLLFLTLALLLAAVACQPQQGSWQRIQESGTLRVGLDPTYPPFEVAGENGLAGLDVDLATALAREMGLEPEFHHFGFDGLYDALATAQVDVLISALVMVPEQTDDFAYSEPYFNAGQILIVPAGSDDIQEMDDLGGRRLAVELGAQGHVEATVWEKRLGDLVVQPYSRIDEALTAVAAGQADAALVDSVSGRLFLATQPAGQRALRRVATPVTVEPYALVVRIEDEVLLAELNAALADLQSGGELERITNTWLGS